jgi:hypothetical protein
MPYTLIATGYPINTFVPNSTTLPTVTDRGLFLDTTLLAAMQTAAAANKVPLVLTGLTVAGLPPAPGRYTTSSSTGLMPRSVRRLPLGKSTAISAPRPVGCTSSL